MGSYYSCHIDHDPAYTCDSYFQDSVRCQDDDTRWVHRCWNSPTRVAYVALPTLLFPFLIFFISMAYRFRQLRIIRQQQISESDQVAQLYGKYAGGWFDYSFDRDILPYIVPKSLRTWCIIERLEYRIIYAAAVMMIFLSCVFIPYGLGTHEQVNPGLLNDAYHLASTGVILGILGGVLCGILMCCQSNRALREERARKYLELLPMEQQQQQQMQLQQPHFLLHNSYISAQQQQPNFNLQPQSQQQLAYVAPTLSMQYNEQNNSTAILMPPLSQV